MTQLPLGCSYDTLHKFGMESFASRLPNGPQNPALRNTTSREMRRCAAALGKAVHKRAQSQCTASLHQTALSTSRVVLPSSVPASSCFRLPKSAGPNGHFPGGSHAQKISRARFSVYTPSTSLDDEETGAGDGGSLEPKSAEERAARAQKRLEQVRRGLEQSTLGFGFSAGGFLYPYHLGVLWELHELNILKDYKVQMAGASAGSLAVATYNCGLDVGAATQALHEFAADCRANGTRYRLGSLLRDFLHAYFPSDAHERCRGNTHVAITRLFPVVRSELVSKWDSKDDFINCLLTSCHIPFYFNGSWMTEYRGRFYMDGGVAAFIPRPPTEYAVKVCCFPVNEVLATVQDRVAQYERVASLLDVAISPDAYEEWPYNYPQMVTWALVPAGDDMLRLLIGKGRKDARAWAQRMLLVPQDAEEAATQQQQQQAGGGVVYGAAGGAGEDSLARAVERVEREARERVLAEGQEGAERAARTGRTDGDGDGAGNGDGKGNGSADAKGTAGKQEEAVGARRAGRDG